MDPITVTLDRSKETPGTFVYSNPDRTAPITALYIKKDAMSGEAPAKIILTVTKG